MALSRGVNWVALTTRRSLNTTAATIFKVTAKDFQARVVGNPVPVVLDCYADWCGPCKQLTPLLRAAVEAQGGAVELALLDTEAEQELAMSIGIRSLPTVFGIYGGQVVDTFVGGQPKDMVDNFVSKLAKHGPRPPKAEQEKSDDEISTDLDLASSDPSRAIDTFKSELAQLREVGQTAGKRRLSKEFDEKAPEAKRAARLLEGIAQCYLALKDVDAAESALSELRDAKRTAVIDKDPELKAAVAKLALTLADARPQSDNLADIRATFAQGMTKSALDAALHVVANADNKDEREKARRLILDFIDALGPSPEATGYRKRAFRWRLCAVSSIRFSHRRRSR